MTLKKLLEFSYELEKNNPDKSAYWHLQQLRGKIRESFQRRNK